MSTAREGRPLGRPEGRWQPRGSLAGRVTLLTTIAVGMAVAFVALGAYVTARVQMQGALDESLRDRARQAASAPLVGVPGGEVPAWALVASDVRIGLCHADGDTYFPDRMGSTPRLGAPEVAVASGKRESSTRTITVDGSQYRVVAVPYPGDTALVLAQSLEPQQRVLAKLGAVMLLFGLSGVVAAGIAGWGVARNGLRPVRGLTASVEEIARTEDLRPLPVEGDDEIARLASAFNQMLTALAASRDRQRQLVADAGHELRTPLTSLRTNLDLLAQSDASPDGLPPEARAELLDDVRAQLEELSTLVGDLVELARDAPSAHVIETLDLTDVVEDAVARVRRRAPGVSFVVRTEPWYVVGEHGALERAVTNLVDNAAKWSPEGGTVRVALLGGVLSVDDEGPGIAEQDLPHVFQRFWRAEESRSMPGSGLGLSIVQQVAVRHSGSVEAGRSPHGGARMVLRLPGVATPPPTGAATPPRTGADAPGAPTGADA